jgi:hypothetical protein
MGSIRVVLQGRVVSGYAYNSPQILFVCCLSGNFEASGAPIMTHRMSFCRGLYRYIYQADMPQRRTCSGFCALRRVMVRCNYSLLRIFSRRWMCMFLRLRGCDNIHHTAIGILDAVCPAGTDICTCYGTQKCCVEQLLPYACPHRCCHFLASSMWVTALLVQ